MKFCTIETATAETIEAALDEALSVVSGRVLKRQMIADASYERDEVKSKRAKVDLQKARELARQGLTINEAAIAFGMTPTALRITAKRYGIKFADGRKKRAAQ